MRTLLFFLWAAIPFALPAQQHDNTWLMGYQSGPVEPGDSYGISILRFTDGAISLEDNAVASLSFWDNNSAFSDSSGNLFAYCNGLQIDDASFLIMENGHEFNKEITLYYQYWSDDDPPQGSMFLPWPGHPDSVLLLYSGDFYIPIPGYGTMNRNLSYAVIDRTANDGLGKVVAREQPILEDTIVYGQVAATLHVIHRPDEAGDACQYQQRGLALPTLNSVSVPNFPNYRLGPLDGSPCDTLGLNNLPVAWWRYEQDTLNPGLFEFRDLSYHEPGSWTWDFGDGMGSSERHPMHLYAGSGAYLVCLSVSNANGASTHCKPLQIPVSAAQPDWVRAIKVGPAPFHAQLRVTLDLALPSPTFRLYDVLGRLVRQESMAAGLNEIDTETLPAGMYFWEIRAKGVRLKTGLTLKTE